MDRGSKVLVTGGAGFIGSHVVDALVDAGYSPRIFDLRPSAYGGSAIDAVIGDLLDLDAIERAMKGCAAVVHLAAAADVDDVARDPVASEAANSRGTVNVLEAARRAGVSRVLYASTIWAYGDATGAVDEDTPLPMPQHLYSATKVAGEMYCHSYAELYGLQPTILRFGIPYGPRARPAGVIPIFVRKALAGEPLTIAGDGRQSRRFIYVEDLAEGVVCALRPQAARRTYNLAGDQSVSVRQIAETVCATIADVGIVHTAGRAGDFAGAEISTARAASELGWRPRTTFAEGVTKYVRWHLEEQPPTAVTMQRRPILRRFARAGRAWVTLPAVAATLVAYLLAVHAIGLSMADERTVAVLSAAALAPQLALGRSGPQIGARWMRAAVLMCLAAIALLALPGARDAARLGSPDLALVPIALAGTALSLTLATSLHGLAARPQQST